MTSRTKSLINPLLRQRLLILQLMRFGVIGGSAAVVNFVVVVALVHLFSMPPLIANIFAFLTAFQVSFFGHKYWTFAHNGGHLSAMSKFLIVAVCSFFLNEGLFAIFLKLFHMQYPIALLLTLVLVPPFTFLFSKIWAFRE